MILVLLGGFISIFPVAAAPVSLPAFVTRYCSECHDADTAKGDLDLDSIRLDDVARHEDSWERVLRKLHARQMPPQGKDRPDERTYEVIIAQLVTTLDRAAARKSDPGRTETFRRLNRIEYQNAVRDLLAVDIDTATLLPKDDASHGFDNVTVGTLSPTLLDRYISAAQKISRLAIGAAEGSPGGYTFRMRADVTQEEHVEGLPLGTRGGALISHAFPQDGEYEIQIRLMRDRNEEIEGLNERHQLEVLLDRAHVKSFEVQPPVGHRNFETVDANLKVRIPITAGPHQVGVTFVKNRASLLENKRKPHSAHFNMHRHPRLGPAIYQVSINGPYDGKGPGDTPSRDRIFVRWPKNPRDEERCAQEILSTLMRRAYRRPVAADEIRDMMGFYRSAATNGFEAGIESALGAVLVSPEFLFRVEQEPAGIAPNTAYRISDLALASRLSFFLWSSIPDEELLEVALRGDLHKPRVLEKQTRRMLADSRANSLANNFAAQWLHLRNLNSSTPDLRLFPDFDDNLRESFRRETELFFESVVREDRNVLDLLTARDTFLNERLAKHYGIPNIYGSRFRRVHLPAPHVRGGLLGHGSILTVTSYATRTSPVLRGNWILANIMGTPPPPPPPNVPALKENTVAESLPMRQRLAPHRANSACASCHSLMDPVGFALENFDAIGRWRTVEDGHPIDVSGGLPDGSTFVGLPGLKEALRHRPELFVSNLSEKLLTFALGRGMESHDAPAIRKIVRAAKADDYRFSAVIIGVVKSAPFTMRKSL